MSNSHTHVHKALSSEEFGKELLLFWLLQTCFKLQVSLDRRFLYFGVSYQEAMVLMRCVEAGEIAPGRLALVLARDKSKITRFIDRLEASALVKRQVNPRDRRYSVISATPKGKRLAERLGGTFDYLRKEMFTGILDGDIEKLSRIMPKLHRNAVNFGKRHVSQGPAQKRIGGRTLLGSPSTLPLQELTPKMQLGPRAHTSP